MWCIFKTPEMHKPFWSPFLHKSSTVWKGIRRKVGETKLSFTESIEGFIEKVPLLVFSCFLSVNSPQIILIMKHHKAIMLNNQREVFIPLCTVEPQVNLHFLNMRIFPIFFSCRRKINGHHTHTQDTSSLCQNGESFLSWKYSCGQWTRLR